GCSRPDFLLPQIVAHALEGSIKKLPMPAVSCEKAYHFARATGSIPAAQSVRHEVQNDAAHGLFVQQIQHLQCSLACALAQEMDLLGLAEPHAKAPGWI